MKKMLLPLIVSAFYGCATLNPQKNSAEYSFSKDTERVLENFVGILQGTVHRSKREHYTVYYGKGCSAKECPEKWAFILPHLDLNNDHRITNEEVFEIEDAVYERRARKYKPQS